jgi:RimJ/RimL family protein N-acetyltransferase
MTDVVVHSPRLTLRPPADADLDAWAALDSDPEATRFIGGLQTRTQSRAGMATVARMGAASCSLFVIERQRNRSSCWSVGSEGQGRHKIGGRSRVLPGNGGGGGAGGGNVAFDSPIGPR